MRILTLSAAVLGGLFATPALAQSQAPARHSGNGTAAYELRQFHMQDAERLRDGRAAKALDEARANVEAFERLRRGEQRPTTVGPSRGGSAYAVYPGNAQAIRSR